MGLKGLPNVLDIRCVGLTAGIDLASRPGEVGKRAYDAMVHAFDAENLVIRVTGETIALTPPLIVSEREIGEIFDKVARVIRAVA
jgi:beta-alanine--pyruvate transaminase